MEIEGYFVRFEAIEGEGYKKRIKKNIKFPDFEFKFDPVHSKYVRQTQDGKGRRFKRENNE